MATTALFHPAYLLRTPGQKRLAWRDLLALRHKLDDLVGDALVLRVPDLTDGQRYGWDELSAAGEIPATVPAIVIIDTAIIIAGISLVVAIYAFDHELARAPKVASNALLGEIRLTWWREVLDEASAVPLTVGPAEFREIGDILRGVLSEAARIL